ncbi:MAG TPA: biotin carboxylase, partial [Saprospiraceae bacterium]|nr:biotin carboxylase [Saprospiraceae bacterium]
LELRVYAEDPLNTFLPSVGKLERYRPPVGEGIRVDDGFEEGMDVPIYYDPMLAKLVVHGATRAEAIQRMKEAIADFEVEGVATTLPFGRFVLDHEAFVSANFDTRFVNLYFSADKLIESHQNQAAVAAMLALRHHLRHKKQLRSIEHVESNWPNRVR